MYDLDDDPSVTAASAALPAELLVPWAELRAALEVSPGTVGRPLSPANPDGLRIVHVADGRLLLVFAVVEWARRVDLLQLTVF